MSVTRIGLAGAHGYGLVHLRRLAETGAAGRTVLTGVADPAGASDAVPDGVPVHADLDALLADQVPDVMIISTPIHTHVPLSVTAMRAGCDVYLEKPPAPSLTAFDALLAEQQATGRLVQVGFQALGSYGFDRIAELVAAGTIGTPRSVAVTGRWLRTRSYYARSPWAGHRTMNGVVVADGVVTNPLSHSIAAALRLAGIATLADIDTITTELYRAHAIECDDTAFVAVGPRGDALPIAAALTLCAPEQLAPRVDLVGDQGRISFRYTEDVLDITAADGSERSEDTDRIDLFSNLLDHRDDPSVPLLSPLVASGPFTGVLQAVQDADAPTVLDGPEVSWHGEAGDGHPVIADIDHWIDEAVAHGGGFAAAGAPFADPATVRVHPIGATRT